MADYGAARPQHEIFHEQDAKTPDAEALTDGKGLSYTYGTHALS